MFGLTKLETYGIIAAIALLAALGSFFYGKHSQHEIDEVAYERKLQLANNKVDALDRENRELNTKLGDRHDDKIEALGQRVDTLVSTSTHAVRLCVDSGSAQAPSVSATGSTPAQSSGGDGSNLRAGPDIEPAILRFAQRCEADRLHVIDLEEGIAKLKEKWESSSF